MKKEYRRLEKKVSTHMDAYQFSYAFGELYEFIWHHFADCYIEELKEGVQSGNIAILEALEEVYFASLVLLHPFMPFVTEGLWKECKGEKTSILEAPLLKKGKM